METIRGASTVPGNTVDNEYLRSLTEWCLFQTERVLGSGAFVALLAMRDLARTLGSEIRRRLSIARGPGEAIQAATLDGSTPIATKRPFEGQSSVHTPIPHSATKGSPGHQYTCIPVTTTPYIPSIHSHH